MFQLLADGDEFAAVAEAQAIEAAELHHDVADLFQIAAFGGPEDQIQCVIEKMRIDLRLQDLYLAVFEVFAKIVLLLHQVPDPPDHDVEAVLQLTDLIGAVHNTVDVEVAGLDNLDLFCKGIDPAGIGTGVEVGEKVDHYA